MPARSRIFSELDEENGSTLDLHLQDIPPAKRHRTGLNSRFDRMIDAMNATNYSPPKSSSSLYKRSSSNSSYGLPVTPVDPYYGKLRSGVLGEDFSVLKIKISEERNENDQSDQFREPLPPWLCETFSTLHRGHPLRLLLPSSPSTPQTESMKFAGDQKIDHSSMTKEKNILHASPSPRLLHEEPLASSIATRTNGFRATSPRPQEQLSVTPLNVQNVPFLTPKPASSTSASTFPPSPRPLLFALSPRSHAKYIPSDFSILSAETRKTVQNHVHSPARPHFSFALQDISSTLFNHQCSTCILSPPSLPPQTCSDLFTTPGPVYCTSRPEDECQPSLDSPRQDTPPLDIDTDVLQFHWTPFDRKQPALITPTRIHNPVLMAQRNGTFPLSRFRDEFDPHYEGPTREEPRYYNPYPHSSGSPLDPQPARCERRHTITPHPSESGGLPTASSNNDYKISFVNSLHVRPMEELHPEAGSTSYEQLHIQRTPPETERPETPCPFRFRPPPLPLFVPASGKYKTQNPRYGELTMMPLSSEEEEAWQVRGCRSKEEQGSMEQEPEQTLWSSIPLPPNALPAFAPAPGIYISPLHGMNEQEPLREADIGKVKNRLLDALDQALPMVERGNPSNQRLSREKGAAKSRGVEIRPAEGNMKRVSSLRPPKSRTEDGIETAADDSDFGAEKELSQISTESIESWGDQASGLRSSAIATKLQVN
ncbi:hypothetical protein L218DRAFT_1073304 [Marasmius fiardii PR-910]|nr:hypothetical protein L218DRAFT_1073304 [Marasmius fiardii PR-910]